MEGKAATKAQRRGTTRCMLGRVEPEGKEFRRLGRALTAGPRRKGSSQAVSRGGGAHCGEKHGHSTPTPETASPGA